MDLTMLFHELVVTIIILVTKPFSLAMLSCLFGVKSIVIVIQTWMDLLRAAIHFHVTIFWRLVVWTVAFVSLPARVLTALQREKLLEMHLNEMQAELETLVWDKQELEERLKLITKERRMMELMLTEIEEEHDQAILRIELLEGELQDVEESNRLAELQGKLQWDSRDRADTDNGKTNKDADKFGITHEIPPWRCSVSVEDVLMHREFWEGQDKSKTEMRDFEKDDLQSGGPVVSFTPSIVSKNINKDEILDQQRAFALYRSLFSAILSLLVGMVIWEAEDPCMPLVVALFSVVGMSLKSVVDFFSTIQNKPVSDAVALLSFNWFILGTLTYPTLPRVAHMFSPLVFSILDRTLRLLGFSFQAC